MSTNVDEEALIAALNMQDGRSVIEKINDVLNSPAEVTTKGLFPYKLVLEGGDGSTISANFEPQMALVALNIINVSVAGKGKGKSTQKGSGEFRSKVSSPMGLFGTYRLHVGTTTARLFDGDEQIWFGSGTQEGLDGVFDIVF